MPAQKLCEAGAGKGDRPGVAPPAGPPTKRLNEQVKRNAGRFPIDFVFQLGRAERDEVVANFDHLRTLGKVRSI